ETNTAHVRLTSREKFTAISIEQRSKNAAAVFDGQDYTLDTWHSICLWLHGKPSTMKFLQSEAIKEKNMILGQEQDAFGRLFTRQQSFIGLLTDVHTWDNMLSPCEIQRYTNQTNFTPGNVLNWGNKQSDCNHENV
uniref:Pentraxin (PTX) domain-containing protein n=1 Tax=Hucho hucho TaxID=62062 RepID=A0A4W5LID6_9TELE